MCIEKVIRREQKGGGIKSPQKLEEKEKELFSS
jgi:hypothetical protein